MSADDEDRPLPSRIRRALDAVVNGPGRIATTAHPDCVCGKQIGTRRAAWLDPKEPDLPVWGTKADCPQHKPEPRTSERVVVDRPRHDGQTHHSPPNAPVIHWPQEPAR